MFFISIFSLVNLILSQCPQKQIYINQTCFTCYYKCATCTNFGINHCTSCQLQYFFSNNTNTCQSCAFYCLVCSNSTSCGSCRQGYYLNQNQLCTACSTGSLTCTLSSIGLCTNYYYLSTVGYLHCLPCSDINCQNCLNASSCSFCTSGYLEFNACLPCNDPNCKICYNSQYCSVCRNSYSIDGNGLCTITCSANCNQCSSSTNCTICSQFYYLDGNNQCIAGGNILCSINSDANNCEECANYSYMSSFSNVCIPYNTYSKQIRQLYIEPFNNYTSFNSSQPISTIFCNTFFVIFSSNQITISQVIQPSYNLNIIYQIYLFNGNSFSQITYSILVLNSTGFNSTIKNISSLISCGNFFSYSRSDSTLYQIPITFNSSNTNFTILFAANNFNIGIGQILLQQYLCNVSNCQICSSNYNCFACVYPYFLQINNCLDACSDGYYTNNFDYTCYDTCPDGFYPFHQDYQCLKCSYPCLTCLTISICLSCSNGTFLFNGYCLNNCSQVINLFYYGNNLTGNCEQCLYPCNQCLNSGTYCKSCIIGYLNLINNTCTLTCPMYYYGDLSTLQCELCISPCATCIIQANICTSCLTLNLYQQQCIQTCPNSTYSINLTCLPCSTYCSICNNTPTNCSSCKLGYLYNFSCIQNCINGTFNSGNICVNCDPSCTSCFGSTNKNCSACAPSYLYYNYSCILNCPSTTYKNNSICILCVSPCIFCLNQISCLSCVEPFFLYLNTCLLFCPYGSYQFNSLCLICPTPCVSCTNISGVLSCEICSIGYYLQNGTCNTNCSLYKFQNQIDNTCDLCIPPCLTCLINPNNCRSCVTGYYIIYNSSQCVTICPNSYYLNGNVCSICINPCSTCNNDSFCLKCISNYYLFNNSCLNLCPKYYFIDIISATCLGCYTPCLSCLSETFCTQCNSSTMFPYLYRSSCLSQCPIGSIGYNSTCLNCASNCQSCYNDINNCTSCIIGYYLYNSSCLSMCPKGYYSSNLLTSCQICNNVCSSCISDTYCTLCNKNLNTFLLGSQCIYTCPNGYFYDYLTSNQTYLCSLCNINCSICSIIAKNCTQCISGLFMPINSTWTLQCLSNCSLTAYQFNSRCIQCESPCLTCKGIQNCLSCIIGFVYFNESCLIQCPRGFYNDTLGNCQPCDQKNYFCEQCIINSSNCKSCINSYYYIQANNTCSKTCPLHFYQYSTNFLNTCLICSDLCLNCIDSITCISCNPTSNFPLLQNFTCTDQCTQGHFQDNYQCKMCSYLCINCTNFNNCFNCMNAYLYKNSCIINCPNYTYPDINLQCLPCIFPCSLCSSNQICLSCVTGYYLYKTYCVQHCPNTTWTNQIIDECVQSCDISLFKYNDTMVCNNSCDQYFTASKFCVLICPSNYIINSSLGCQICKNNNCSSLLYFKTQAIVYQNQLVVVIIFSQTLDSVYNNSNLFNIKILNQDYIFEQTGLLIRNLSNSENIIKTTRQYIWISYQISNNLFTSILETNLTNQKTILSTNYPIQNVQYITQILYYKIYSDSSPASSEAFAFIGKFISCIILILVVINLLLDNIRVIIYQIQLVQIFYFLNYLEIWYPPQISLLTTNFQMVSFRYELPISFKILLWNSPPKNILLSTDVSFYRNCLFTIILLMGFIILCFLLKLIMSKFEKIKIKHQFIWNHIHDAFWLFGFNIGLFAIFHFKSGDLASNIFVSAIFFTLFITISLMLSYNSIKQIYNQSFNQKTFFWNLDTKNHKNSLSHMAIPLFIIRRLIIVFSTGIFYVEPLYCLFLTFIINLLIISNHVVNSPYKRHKHMLLAIEIIFAAYIATHAIYILNIEFLNSNQCQIFGWIEILQVIIIICLLLFVIISQTYLKIKRIHRKLTLQETNVTDQHENIQETDQKPKEVIFDIPKQQIAHNQDVKSVKDSQNIHIDIRTDKISSQEDANKMNIYMFESDTESIQFDKPAQFLIQCQKKEKNEEEEHLEINFEDKI